MRIRAKHPVGGIRGRFKDSPMVFYTRRGYCFARAYVRPRDPRTDRQIARRTEMAGVSRAWADLSEAQRAAWQAYGERWFGEAGAVGFNTFVKVSTYRLAVPSGAPSQAPPSALVAAAQESAGADDAFAFRLEHGIAQPSGWKVLVRITPATVAPTRAPRHVDLRWICGNGAASLAQLPASGGVIRFSGARFAVAAGERYGVRVRLVSPEGVPGPELELDLIKQQGVVVRRPAPARLSAAKNRRPRVSLFFEPNGRGAFVSKNGACLGPIRAMPVRWPAQARQ